MQIAEGTTYPFWTFGDQVPGQFIRRLRGSDFRTQGASDRTHRGSAFSTVLTVLDQRGTARGRVDGLEQPLDEMTRVLHALTADPDSPRR